MEKQIMYEKILSDLKKKISAGEYGPGDRIPSEKEIGEAYQVSRITAKKAMEILAEESYIVRQPGRGSFVNKNIEDVIAAPSQQIPSRMQKPKRRKRIGVIFDTFGNDFGTELLRSIEQECTRRRFDMLFRCTYGNMDDEVMAVQDGLDAGVDGFIVMCAQGEVYNSAILQLSLNRFPIVTVDRQIKGVPIPCIKSNNFAAARELTDKLIEHGNKKICFLTHASIETSTISERYGGFSESIVKNGTVTGVFAKIESYNPAPMDIEKEYGRIDLSEYKKIAEDFGDCTAFLTAEYKIAVLLRRALEETDIKKEIATFDSIETVYRTGREFTLIKQNESLMGKKALEVLTDLMDGKKTEMITDVPYILRERKAEP